MTTVNIYEAKTHLSKLLERAAAGEDVVIARSGKPIARLTRLEEPRPRVRFGVLGRKIEIADDFDSPLPESIIAAFEGR